MRRSKISDRYAGAYFDLAKEKEKVDLIKNDVDLINSVCSDNPEFMTFFRSPVISKSQKLDTFFSVFSGKVDDLTADFIRLVVHNNRELLLPDMCHSFSALYLKEKQVKEVYLTAAAEFDKATVGQIKVFLENELKAKVELYESVDPRLIGGFILRIDDREINASVAAQLDKMRKKLTEHVAS